MFIISVREIADAKTPDDAAAGTEKSDAKGAGRKRSRTRKEPDDTLEKPDDTRKKDEDAAEVNNQAGPSTSVDRPEKENNGTPPVKAGGLAPPFRMNGKAIAPDEQPEKDDEFSAKQWGLTEAERELPFAKDAAALLDEELLMEGID